MQVIAERSYDFHPADGSPPVLVVLRFGAPFQEGADWRGPVEIVGPGPRRVFREASWGIDSAGALAAAITLAPSFLQIVAGRARGRFTFLGEDHLEIATTERQERLPPRPRRRKG
jgi:hypothetical protein